jgi:endonuclease YncB( thermonuclease family)
MRLALALALGLALPGLVHAETLKGKVVMVIEGDLLALDAPKGPVTVRLAGADCPEPGQPHADEARQLVGKLALGKLATATLTGVKDPDGRARARVCLGSPHEARCLDEELLRAGLAWRDPLDGSEALAKLEAQARAGKRGLWADASPTPPWEWRKAHPGTLKGTLVGDAPGHAAIDVTHPVCVERKARVAHWFTCALARGLSCTLKTAAQAKGAGLRLHGCLTGPADAPPPPVFRDGEHACRRDSECILVEPKDCCACGSVWMEAVNRSRIDRARLIPRKCAGCKPCPTPATRLGSRAVCVRGFCEPR